MSPTCSPKDTAPSFQPTARPCSWPNPHEPCRPAWPSPSKNLSKNYKRRSFCYCLRPHAVLSRRGYPVHRVFCDGWECNPSQAIVPVVLRISREMRWWAVWFELFSGGLSRKVLGGYRLVG